MKVLHIIENIDNSYGGPAKSVPFLIKYLNNLNIENKIISIKLYEKEKNDICIDNNIEIINSKYNFFKFLKYSKNFCTSIIENLEKDIILHTHSLWNYPPYCAYKISKKYNIPLVMSIRGNLYDWNLKKSKWKKDLSLNFFQMKMFKDSSCLHATEINEVKAIRKLGIKTPIALISNGIETQEFENLLSKKEALQQLNLTNKRYILFMSRIDPKKGLEFLIDAYIKLHKKYSEWEIIIAGPIYDKKYFQNIKEKIKKYNIDDKVHYFGMVNGIKRLNIFAVSDIFILPAHTENFGMVIGEAMASKLPVITTTGTPWSILNEKNAGWWIDLKQENILKTLDKAMQKEKKELKQMGLNGFKIIKEEFEWKRKAVYMKKVYNWILGKEEKPSFIY